MKKLNFIWILIFSILLLFNACSLFVRPPFEPELEQLSSSQIYFYDWEDELDYAGLGKTVEQSIRYYKRLPENREFQYGRFTYSPEEMVASMNLFMEIVGSSPDKERINQLREKFLFYESKNSEGEAFFTGYYEPVIEGSELPTEEFSEPLYETPEDLIEVNLGQFSDSWTNERIVGRMEGKQLVPYDSRDEIVHGKSLKERAGIIAYVNGIELFFLQIQGSGLIRFTDGNLKRVNYAQKNGHPYRAVGQVLKDKIPPEKMSLQSIKEYLYANPDEADEILSYNQSYTFFREVDEGPLGDIEVPLTPDRSIAMDKRVIPRGGLAFIETELPVFENEEITGWRTVKRFVLVQDTGGAIRDHGRVDLFLGNGKRAGLTAGHLKHAGRSFLIIARKEFLP
jgi:membrane-bound lytic murein transglycosylase A